MPEEHGDWIKRLVSDYGLSEEEAHIFSLVGGHVEERLMMD